MTEKQKQKIIDSDALTTGQISILCKVAPKTVAKWIDTGRLKGYKLPSGGDRRAEKTEVLSFMKLHRLPIPQWLIGEDSGR